MIEWEMIVAIVAILMGSLIFIIPVAAFALRFAAKPVIEAFARYKELERGSSQQLDMLRDRLALLEQRLEGVDDDVQRLAEKRDFDRQLRSPTESSARG